MPSALVIPANQRDTFFPLENAPVEKSSVKACDLVSVGEQNLPIVSEKKEASNSERRLAEQWLPKIKELILTRNQDDFTRRKYAEKNCERLLTQQSYDDYKAYVLSTYQVRTKKGVKDAREKDNAKSSVTVKASNSINASDYNENDKILIAALKKMTALSLRLATKNYISHYPIQRELKVIKAQFTSIPSDVKRHLVDKYKTDILMLQTKLKALELSNQKIMQHSDFALVTLRLIQKNDLDNLKGWIGIAEFFGTRRGTPEMMSVLDDTYAFFKKHPAARPSSIKPCLDYLAKLVNDLPFTFETVPGTSSSSFFQTTSEQFKSQLPTILKRDQLNDLHQLISPTISTEDLNFALRLAAKEGAQSCFAYLIGLHFRGVDVLSQGQPSLQIALHRAVSAGQEKIVALLLDTNIISPVVIYRQFLIKEKHDKTPLDLIPDIKNNQDRMLVIQHFKSFVQKYVNPISLRVTPQDQQNILDQLDEMYNLCNNYSMS